MKTLRLKNDVAVALLLSAFCFSLCVPDHLILPGVECAHSAGSAHSPTCVARAVSSSPISVASCTRASIHPYVAVVHQRARDFEAIGFAIHACAILRP